MTDLLSMLGDEWAPPAPVVACSSEDRLDATHGCRSCGRAPTTWSEVHGCYLDGMGRRTRCNYCPSCVGSGRTSVRDPWTDKLLDWRGAPCRYCEGGWTSHAWDCSPEWHERGMVIHPLEPATVWGVTFDGRTVFTA
jgi:hypothetical protein